MPYIQLAPGSIPGTTGSKPKAQNLVIAECAAPNPEPDHLHSDVNEGCLLASAKRGCPVPVGRQGGFINSYLWSMLGLSHNKKKKKIKCRLSGRPVSSRASSTLHTLPMHAKADMSMPRQKRCQKFICSLTTRQIGAYSAK